MTLRGLEPVKPRRLRVSSALVLYRLRWRKRWVQELLAMLGIAAGVALLYATQVASTSLSGPIRTLNDGLVGDSQLQVLSRGSVGFSDTLYRQVLAIPGVRHAAPVLQVPGNVVGPRGERAVTFFGSDPRLLTLRGTLMKGVDPADAAQADNVFVPRAIAAAIGTGSSDDYRVQMAGRTAILPAAIPTDEQLGPLAGTSIAIAPLAYLQRLAGLGHTATRILVEARPGQVDRVRRGLQDLVGERGDVRSAGHEAALFDEAVKPTSRASTIFSILSALVGWMFAVCALLVTAQERRRLASQQRDQGYPPSSTLVTLLVDAAVVGIVGTVVGLAAGEALSRHGFESDVSFLSGAFPIGDQRVVTWQSVALAVAGGMAAAAFGVLAPVRQVVGASLPGSLRRARLWPRRSDAVAGSPRALGPLLGLACLATAAVITIAAPGAAVVGLVALGLALVLLLPAILAGTIAALDWVGRRRRSLVAVVLALQQLNAPRWRTRALAIATTGAVAVFGATALQGARANLQDGLNRLAGDLNAPAPIWVAPGGAGSATGTSPFAPTATRTLARLPGVGGVELYRAGLLDLQGRRVWIIGAVRGAPQPIPRHQVLAGGLRQATARIRAGGWITVSRELADDLGLAVGDSYTLPGPRPITLRVAAITTNLSWASGAMLMNADDFRRAWGSDTITAYQVRPAAGVTVADAGRQVAAALGPRSALRVESAAQRAERQRAVSRAGLARLKQIAALTLIIAVLAMSAAMTGLLWQHRPVVSDLKLHGLSTSLMWRSLGIETAVLFGTGALAGGVFGLFGQVLCTRGLQVLTGFPVVEGLQLGIAAVSAGLVIGTSLLVVLVPGYLVAHARPTWRD
jgi:putative ABC transport system permease protein